MRILWDTAGGDSAEAVKPATARGTTPYLAALKPADDWTDLGSQKESQRLAGQVGSSNFTFTAPVAHYSGRGDLSLHLDLVFNSRVWQRVGSATSPKMVFDIDDDWPAPGWSLHMGQLVGLGVGAAMIVEPDGTRRPFRIDGTNDTGLDLYMSAHTTDGSHIEYQAHWRFQGVGHRSPRLQSGWLVRSNGTRVDFDFRTGGTVHATRLTDRNGNVIDVGYDATIQRLSKIIDTCGQVISFVYRENKFGEMVLARVLGPAPNADWSAPATDTDLVRLNMSSRELRTSFQDPVHEPASRVPIISGIYYPATGTGYWLPPSSYSSYGMLKLVQACRGMSLGPTTSNTDGPPIVAGPVTWQREYNYPDSPGLEQKDAPTYTTMSESWDGGSAVTTEFLVQRTVTGARTEITWPDNAKTVQEVDSAGLLKELRVMDPWGQVLQRTQMDHWQIAPDGTPQILAVDVTDDAGHVAKTTFFYGGPSTEPTIVDQWNHAPHRDAAVRVLRRTEIDYVTDERYLRRNLRNLLKAVRVFGQFDPYLTNARPLASRIEYEYDQTPLVPAPGIVGFDAKFDPASPGYAPETTWRGNPTTTRRYTNAATGSFPVAETRTYDLAGNLFRSEIGPGRVEYKYTPAFRFLIPATIRLTGTQASAPTMELTNTVTATWGGSPVYVTDANGQATIHGYDAAGRLTSTTSVATGSGTQVVIDDTARTRATTTTSGGPGGPRLEYATTATLNGRGRTTSTRTQDVQGDVTVSYQYDFRDRLRLVTASHRDGDPYKFSSVDLDQLDRPLELIDLNRGVTRWYYNENARPDNRVSSDQELFATVRVVGANGTEQWKSFDALNRLREAVDPAPDGPGTILPTGALCTSYSYDGLDNITAIDLHTAGMPVQHRRFRHDSLGRLVRQYLPERGTGISETVDGATQYWSDSFTYDERSNLIQKEDSRGILTNFEYANDPFNRLQQVFGNPGPFRDHGHPVHVTGPVYYEYETTGDLRRVHIENCSGVSQRTYDHDPVVGLTSVTTTMSLAPDRPFTIDYDHDRLARVRATTFPARYGDDAGAGNQRPVLEVTRQFGGLVDELSVNGDTLVHGTAYTAAGQISHLLIGPNDIDESYKRDLPNPLLLSGQSLSHANAAFSNVDYNYHPAATASRQPPQLHVTEDLLDPSKTRVATYDRLGRLDDYDGGPQPTGIWGEKYRYDLHGNRLSATPRGEIVPGTPAPSDGLQELAYEDSTNRVLTAGFNNDAAGNLTSARINGIDYKYQYDLAGRLAWVHNGATQEVTGYLFGACNRRRATIRLGATTWPPTHHPGGVPPTEIKSATFYIWDEDTVIATYEANRPDIQNTLAWKELSFNLGDRLLSTWERVDSTLKRVRYHHPGLTGTRYVTEPEAGPLLGVAHEALPYGGALVHDAGISSPFTSYDRDTSTGLDYAVNRFYHPELGRFLQPDPLGAEGFTSDSSSMNLYAYCNDDPINRTDPLGLLWRVSCVQAGDGPMICTGTWTPDRGPILPGGRTIGGGGAGEGGGERGSGGGGGGGGEKSAPKSEPDQDARIEAFWKCAEPKLETMGIIATVGGAAIGALGGGIVGGIAGASLGTLAAPGPGTVGGAIVGVGKGVFEGAAAGLGVGALTGGAYALTSCPSPF